MKMKMDSKSKLPCASGLLLCVLLFSVSLASAQISIEVDNQDTALFQGQSFTRLCFVEGTTDEVFFEWLLNGVVVHSDSGANLELSIPSVDLSDQGDYSCRVILADNSVLGPQPAGELVVLDSAMVNAPSIQYVEHGVESSMLNCSYPGALTTWRKDGEPVTGELISPSFNIEGLYECELFFFDQPRGIQAVLIQTIRLYIFVKVDILSHPPPYTLVNGNPPHTMTVAFAGRQAQNMSIIWYRDGIALPGSLVNTTYSPSQLSGTTQVKFPRVTRNQEGVYRVVLRSQVGSGVYPVSDTEEEVSFQLDVRVPPATPTDFSSDDVFATSALFKWALTNQNADEGADTFVLHLTYKNGSLFRNETFPGGVSERSVSGLLPGTSYHALLVAKNVDGTTSVGPIPFTTEPGAPMLNSASIERRNSTHFTATVSLAYTGGGIISDVVLHIENEPPFMVLAVQSPEFNLVWTGDFSITDSSLNPEEELVVFVLARNEHGFNSNSVRVAVSADTSTTVPPTQDGSIDPSTLMLICVIVGVVLITVVLFVVIIVTICLCKRCARRGEKSYSPREHKHSSEEKQLDNDNAMVTRGATAEQNLADATIRLGSVPSVHTPTHPDDRYIDTTLKKFGHQRTPSNASSKASSNRSHPASNASYSPNTMLMNKLQNEKNAYSMYETGSQLSQAESELMMRPGYSQSRLTNSTCSSVHSSFQNVSIPSRHIPSYEHHHPHPRTNFSQTIEEEVVLEYPAQQHRPHQYQNHSLSISGSEMDARPPSESICTCSVTTGGEVSPEYVYMHSTTEYPHAQQVSAV